MLSAILMLRRLAESLRIAFLEEDFGRILSAGLALVLIGTLAYSLGEGWSVVDGLYVAVATLTTSSILDPKLTITDPWLKGSSRPGTYSSESASWWKPLAGSGWHSSSRGRKWPRPRQWRRTSHGVRRDGDDGAERRADEHRGAVPQSGR